MRRFIFSVATLVFVFFVVGRTEERSLTWAVPVESRHLKNVFQLDAKVYRSAQPSHLAFKEARDLGVTDVLNLRDNHSDGAEAKGLGLNLHRVKCEADEIDTEKIIQSLRVIRLSKGPVLVHCWHGSDRTGAVCAMYRIVFNNWSKEEAIDELVNGGFGYHKMYANIIELVRESDVQKIKEAVFSR